MKYKSLLMLALALASTQGWASQTMSDNTTPAIAASVETLDYGQVEIGYPVTETFIVNGYNLDDNINLAVTGNKSAYYQVTPQTITPQSAASGVVVTVKCSPVSYYISPASITLTSMDAEDVIIPIHVDAVYPEQMFINNQVEEFTALVGQMVTRTGGIRFADAEVPQDPNQPVVMSNDNNNMLLTFGPSSLSSGYSLTLEGTDKSQFTARIVKSSSIANLCTVAITYAPHATGSHQALLKVYCNSAGVPLVTIKLHGDSSGILGDLDGNNVLNVNDLTQMIDLLLNNSAKSLRGDFDDNGTFNIDDVTEFISYLLTH